MVNASSASCVAIRLNDCHKTIKRIPNNLRELLFNSCFESCHCFSYTNNNVITNNALALMWVCLNLKTKGFVFWNVLVLNLEQ